MPQSLIALLLIDQNAPDAKLYLPSEEPALKRDAVARSKKCGYPLDVFGMFSHREVEFMFTVEYLKHLDITLVQIVKQCWGPYASPLKDERTIFSYGWNFNHARERLI